MSTEYEANVVVGYYQLVEKVFRPFFRATIDGCEIVIDDEAYEGPPGMTDPTEKDWNWVPDTDALEALGKLLECQVDLVGGEHTSWYVTFQPLNLGRVDDGYTIESIAQNAADIKRIARAAKETGLDIGKPGIYALVSDY
jgi:hypothetical protein